MENPLSRYNRLLEQCEIRPDNAQKMLVMRLQNLFDELCAVDKKNSWERFFARPTPSTAKGIYLWGEVGRGKSMLMDLFFASLPFSQKLRQHFHEFMRDIHAQIHEIRQNSPQNDPLTLVAENLVKKYRVLCFDELQVHDIADAMILSRLFSALFAQKMVVVFTSNRPPEQLYLNGLQRELFLPFIKTLQDSLEIQELLAPKDYRLGREQALQQRWLTPLNAQTSLALQEIFVSLTSHVQIQSGDFFFAQSNEPGARKIHISQFGGGVAWFSFAEICGQALGASDYLSIAQKFSTIIIAEIHVLSSEQRNEAKRFVTLIDVLYEQKTKTIVSAATPPELLYPQGDGNFEFARTVSRLLEMQSEGW